MGLRRTAIVAGVFTVASLLPAGGNAAATPTTAPPAPERYEEALRFFIETAEAHYPFFDVKNIRADWSLRKSQWLADVRDCTSPACFSAVIAQAAACLRDGHAGLYDLPAPPPVPPRYFPGVSFSEDSGEAVVVLSAALGLPGILAPGVIVTTIDGQDARTVLERDACALWQQGGFFSSPQRARLFAYRIPLQGAAGDLHTLTVRSATDTQTVQVANHHEARGWPHVYAYPAGLARHGALSYGRLESGFGYLYLRRVPDNLPESLDAALRALRDIDGLIVDLRGNGGGGYSGELHRRYNRRQPPPDDVPHYRGPLAVLIDAGTFSAGETLARDLAQLADAHLLGATTAGSSGRKQTWDLPHGLGRFRFTVRGFSGLHGLPCEYYGIPPDDSVVVDLAELCAGKNSGIRRAEEYLARVLQEQPERWERPFVVLPESDDLETTGQIVGTVLDRAGRAVPGARVWAERLRDPLQADGTRTVSGSTAPVIADASGRFGLSDVPAGWLRVRAEASSGARGEGVDFELPPRSGVELNVRLGDVLE